MSKSKASTIPAAPPQGLPVTLPTTGDPELFNRDEIASETDETTEAQQKPEPAPEPLSVELVSVELPVLTFAPRKAFASRRIDGRLNRKQAANLKRLEMALVAEGIKLESGKHVSNKTDALRWLLENIPETQASGG